MVHCTRTFVLHPQPDLKRGFPVFLQPAIRKGERMPKAFYAVLANSLVASVITTSVWFAVTFWAYLETQSVIVTSVMAGIFLVTIAVSGIYLGSLVDRFPKKTVILLSSLSSLVLFALAGAIYAFSPAEAFRHAGSPLL